MNLKYFGQTAVKYFGQRFSRRLLCTKKEQSVNSDHKKKLEEHFRKEESYEMVVPIFKKALLYGNNICINDFAGQYSYLQLYSNSKKLSRQISNICDSGSSSTVAFFYSNDVLTTLILWACWMSGQMALPLRCDQNFSYLSDFMKEAKTKLIITPEKHSELGQKHAARHEVALLVIDHLFIKNLPVNYNLDIVMNDKFLLEGNLQNEFYVESPALMLNNSMEEKFENAKSKTVILSHKDLNSQIKTIAQAWNITSDDRILHVIPSHYIYEYISSSLVPLSVGSSLQIIEASDGNRAWSFMLGINVPIKERINVVIAEPKVYEGLILEYEKIFAKKSSMVEHIRSYCSRYIRLMAANSGMLPPVLISNWLQITGHTLQEYNLTAPIEIDKAKKSATEDANKTLTLSTPNVKVRVVNAENKVLLESDGASFKKFNPSSTTVVGRLMLSEAGQENYLSTGDIVSYHNGVFNFIGRHVKN